jgi:hypothetical protein
MPPVTDMDIEGDANGLEGGLDLSKLLGPQGFSVDEKPMGTGMFELDPATGDMFEVQVEDDLLPAVQSQGFAENLAEQIPESELDKIGSSLFKGIEEDIESREPWKRRYTDGLRMMGLLADEVDDGPFPGASTAVMPIINEAIVQFWARSLSEQVPSEGPVKTKVSGKANKALNERAERVREFMNYDVMSVDKAWYTDHSRMLWSLPIEGSTFKKSYRDRQLGRNRGEYVAAEDFIVNYAFRDLDTAPRFTHRVWKTKNELRKDQVAGVYLDIDLSAPSGDELTEEAEARIEVTDFDAEGEATEDSRYELYECYCEIDPPGFEDPDGIARPYIVTIDRKSQKVLSIYRNWKEQDTLLRRRVFFIKYDYIPGPGFYALGFFHLIGGLQQAATGALRLLIDGSATASLQGGFMSKDASMKDGSLTLEPGVWKQVDATAEDLSKAFFTPPTKEPSPALFQVLGLLIQRAEKFAATTEMQTGSENAKNMPVGSTMAMLEAGSKVFSTIHRGLHISLAAELLARRDLIQEFMPVEGYPYDVEGNHQGLMAEDFAPGVQVVPVSDPNIFSTTQRIAQNQAVYSLAVENPDVLKKPVAIRRVLEGLKVPDIDELWVSNEPPPPMDPVSEIQALLRGEPVQAYPDQNHSAYLSHYWSFLNNPQYGGNPEIQKQIGPTAMALVGQRLAYAWATQARGVGIPAKLLPPPMGEPEGQAQGQASAPNSPMQIQGPSPSGMGIQGMQNGMQGGPQGPAPAVPTDAPPEVIAQMAAQLAPQMAQVPGMPALGSEGQGDPSGQAKADAITQESGAKVAVLQQAMNQKAELHEQTLVSKAEEANVKIGVEQAKADMKMQIEDRKAQAAEALQAQKTAREQQRIAAEGANDQRNAILQAQDAERQNEAHQMNLVSEAAITSQNLEAQAQNQVQDQVIAERESTARTQVMKQKAAQKPKAGKKP